MALKFTETGQKGHAHPETLLTSLVDNNCKTWNAKYYKEETLAV